MAEKKQTKPAASKRPKAKAKPKPASGKPQLPAIEGKTRSVRAYTDEEANELKARLTEGLTDTKLEAIEEVPKYLKELKEPRTFVDQRVLPNLEETVKLLDTYFEVEPVPTVVSLCVFLGISRDILYDTLEGRSNKDLTLVMQKAVDKVESSIVRAMILGRFNTIGCIFYLKNAFGYKDRENVDRTENIAAVQVNVNVNRE